MVSLLGHCGCYTGSHRGWGHPYTLGKSVIAYLFPTCQFCVLKGDDHNKKQILQMSDGYWSVKKKQEKSCRVHAQRLLCALKFGVEFTALTVLFINLKWMQVFQSKKLVPALKNATQFWRSSRDKLESDFRLLFRDVFKCFIRVPKM